MSGQEEVKAMIAYEEVLRPAAKQGPGLLKFSICALCALLFTAPAVAGEMGFFEEATFSGRKLGFSIVSSVQVSSVANLPQIISLDSSASSIEWLMVEQRHNAAGISGTTRAWLDPLSLVVARRTVSTVRRKSSRHKLTHFGQNAIDVLRLKDQLENGQEPEWQRAQQSTRDYPSWMGGDVLITDPLALLLIGRDTRLQDLDDQVQMVVYSRDNLVLLDLTVAGVEKLNMNLVLREGEHTKKLRERREALRIRIDASHLGVDSDQDDMEVLGMRGDVELLLDRSWRVPLMLRGRAPGVGAVKLALTTLNR
jgi:hypothetical protein